jgi:hypothetical protein
MPTYNFPEMERDFWEKIARKELMRGQGIVGIIRSFCDTL